MGTYHSIVATVLGLSTCTSLGIAGFALYRSSRRGDRNGFSLAALTVPTAALAAGELLLWLSWTSDSTVSLLWSSSLPRFFLPVAWLVLALQFGGFERFVTRRTVVGLSIVPASALGLASIGSISTLDVGSAGYEGLASTTMTDSGLALFLATAYTDALVLVGSWILGHLAYRSRGGDRGQTIAIVIAASVPPGATLPVARAAPFDVAPVAFTVSGIALGYVVFRRGGPDAVPAVRESVVEHVRDGIVVTDEDGRIVDLNVVARRLLAVDAPGGGIEATGEVSNDDGGRTGDGLLGADASEVRIGGRSVVALLDADSEVELSLETETGTRYVSVRSMSHDDDVGGDVLILQDVTDRRSTEQRYRAFIENATDIVTVLEPDGTIRYQSPAVERVLGYTPDEMIGDLAFDYVHPSDTARIVDTFSAGTATDDVTIRTEYRMRHADGGWRTVESTGSNLIDDHAVEGIVVNSRDVTERRRRERELEVANERLDEFAGVVSHDLRNPLSVAQGYLELLDESVDEGEAVSVVRDQHDRMEAIIDDALALARTGAVVDRTESVDLERVARLAWGSVDTGNAVLEVVGSRRFEADRDKLLRALENVFRNCVEHAADGREGTSPVSVEVGTTAGGFYVADDGPGIPPDARGRLFEPGFTSSPDGTGLGLSIVSKITRAHGWTVETTDEADGARFDFTIDPDVDPDEDVVTDGAPTRRRQSRR